MKNIIFFIFLFPLLSYSQTENILSVRNDNFRNITEVKTINTDFVYFTRLFKEKDKTVSIHVRIPYNTKPFGVSSRVTLLLDNGERIVKKRPLRNMSTVYNADFNDYTHTYVAVSEWKLMPDQVEALLSTKIADIRIGPLTKELLETERANIQKALKAIIAYSR